jgi:antibiotic biosynthesis monooxygenase (ABM) superfamily enzyme
MATIVPQPLTVAITRRVRAGHEAEFEAALGDFMTRSMQEPGLLGVHVLRQAPRRHSQEYGIIRRFENEAVRDAFYQSPVFREYESTVAPFVEGEPRYESVTGLEGWFTLPGAHSVVPPPRHKMALATLLGVYPMSLFWGWAIAPVSTAWPHFLRSFVVAALVVVSLTWCVMPLINKVLRPWLHGARTH